MSELEKYLLEKNFKKSALQDGTLLSKLETNCTVFLPDKGGLVLINYAGKNIYSRDLDKYWIIGYLYVNNLI